MISAKFDARSVQAAFDGLYDRFTPGVVGESLVDTVKPFRDDLQRNLEASASGPHSTGRTAAQGAKVVLTYDRSDGPVVTVGMKSRGKLARAFIGYWLEHGIPSRGLPARPWFRPAWDVHLPRFLPRFAAALGKRAGFR